MSASRPSTPTEQRVAASPPRVPMGPDDNHPAVARRIATTRSKQSPFAVSTAGALESGVALLGLLASLLVFGMLALFILRSTNAPRSALPTALSHQVSNGKHHSADPSIDGVANLTACRSDLGTLRAAIEAYRVVNGTSPPAGTSWALSADQGGPFLPSWPSLAPALSFTWNGSILHVVVNGGSNNTFVKTTC